jgi:predicted transcriptional regulator
MNQGLTEKERRVYKAAISLLNSRPYPPTFPEVAQEAKLGYTTVHRAIWHLVELGALKFDPRSKRSLSKGTPLSKLLAST